MSFAKIFLIAILLQEKATGIKLERCTFIKALRENGITNFKQAATFACLAEKLTNFETKKVTERLDEKYYGLFQINSKYWCSEGGGCDLPCENLVDDDLRDDIKCAHQIHNETARIKESGFEAWPTYEICKGQEESILASCGIELDVESNGVPATLRLEEPIVGSKIFNKCELAKELVTKHNVHFDIVGTMVCIANEESHFNTSAIGSLNKDGSEDYGIFQISGKYWCSNRDGGGCNTPCSLFLDSNLTDDVACFKTIYDETARFSKSGFDAWAVFTREKDHCRDINQDYIHDCFNDDTEGKIFGICELIDKMKGILPDDLLADFACIALYESSLSTGIKNWGRHGIFQINEQKWCHEKNEPPKGCDVLCENLRDANVTDDIQCVKRIHTLLGFSPWPSYRPYCLEKSYDIVQGCRNVPRPKRISETNYYLIQISDLTTKIKSTYQVHKSQLKGNYIKIKTNHQGAEENNLDLAVTIETENKV